MSPIKGATCFFPDQFGNIEVTNHCGDQAILALERRDIRGTLAATVCP